MYKHGIILRGFHAIIFLSDVFEFQLTETVNTATSKERLCLTKTVGILLSFSYDPCSKFHCFD